jgi:hypothetical protein
MGARLKAGEWRDARKAKKGKTKTLDLASVSSHFRLKTPVPIRLFNLGFLTWAF